MNFLRKRNIPEVLKNSSLLLSGNMVGQAFAFLVYPLLTRLYSQETFSIFATFSAVTGLFTILGTAKYDEGLLITKDNKETLSLLGFCLKYTLVFSAVLFLVFAFFRNSFFSFFKVGELSAYWYFIPLTVLCTGFYYIVNCYYNRQQKFRIMTLSGVVYNIMASLSKIGLALGGFVHSGLIAGNFTGQLAGCLPALKVRAALKRAFRGKTRDQLTTAFRYKSFPLYNQPRAFVNYFSGNLPFLLLPVVFGNQELGVFSIALVFISRPVVLINSSLYNVLCEQTARLQREKKKLMPSLFLFYRYFLPLVLVGFFILYIIAPLVFPVLLGKGWENTGQYVRLLIPWICMLLIEGPLGFIPLLFEKQKYNLYLEAGCLLIRLAGIYTGIVKNDFYICLQVFALAGFLLLFIRFFWHLFLIRKHDKTL